VKYAFIRAHCPQYRVSRLCEVLEVSPSGYYDWRDRPERHRDRENRRLTEKIRHYHRLSHGRYGSPKIHQDLVSDHASCGVHRVARLMKAADIKSKMARRFILTTDSRNTLQPAPDLLQRHFTVDKPDTAWICDTTFIGTRAGWLYLAVILDLFSRQVIGWAMGNRNNTELVQAALTMALGCRGPVRGTIVHSDQAVPMPRGRISNHCATMRFVAV
jgi:transposase InsO family protein